MPVHCFVSFEIHPTTMGGCGVLIHHEAHRLLERGHDVVLLLDVPGAEFRRFNEKDRPWFPAADRCRAYRVDDLLAGASPEIAAARCLYQRQSLRFAHALRALLAREHVDCVEFFDYCGAAYSSLVERLYRENDTDRPVLTVRLHGTLEVLDRHGAGLARDSERLKLYAMEHGALALAETVLAPSRTYADTYYRPLYGLQPGRTLVSPPPMRPLPRDAHPPAPGEPPRITLVGRMCHMKGVDQFVRAAVALLRQRPGLDARFDLIGADSTEGPGGVSYTAYLKRLIPPAWRDRFRFLGFLSHDRLIETLDGTLFAVFPNRVESFCYVLHEVHGAGVPVIVNAIPAFADYFRDRENALVYDGTTRSLTDAMETLIDDAELRARIRRPGSNAAPAAPIETTLSLEPLARMRGAAPTTLAVVLFRGEPARDDELAHAPGVESLAAQGTPIGQIVCLIESAVGDDAIWWLGRWWRARTPGGEPIDPASVLSAESLVVLDSHDCLHPGWLAYCTRALTRRPSLGFAGTWSRRAGALAESVLDIAPELYPFEEGADLPRVLCRTRPGVPIEELLEPGLRALGLLGLVWGAVAEHRRGVLLPEPLIDIPGAQRDPADPSDLKALILQRGMPFAERLALIAGLLSDRVAARDSGSLLPRPDSTIEAKVRIADELNGTTLARLALRKLAAKVSRGVRG